MVLIEREGPLAALDEIVAGLQRGSGGRLVLVPGEAGAGKTAVVRAFLDALPRDAVRLVGSCDSLRTARPFGPVLDWAAERDPSLVAAVADGLARELVLERALGLLTPSLTVAVVEDAHWADEATLDVLSFLARRLDRTRAALVVTYRADETGPRHPLTVLLGELARLGPTRLPIAPLTAEGVARLSDGSDLDPADLHRRTGGNAFYVTECLSPGEDRGIPATVRDAVLARVDRLGSAERDAVDAVAAVPGRAELWLAKAMGATGPAIDGCVARGVLVADGGVRFRHELAREAVHDALLPDRRQRIHGLALAALEAPPDGRVDHARATHHAVGAGDLAAVARHAPLAAAAAEAAGARREAVAHLELALDQAGLVDGHERLELWSRLGEQRSLLGRHADAVEAYRAAVAVAAGVGDDGRRGALLARLVTPLTMAGDIEAAGRAVDGAVALLEGTAGSALALAYAQRCSLHMLAREVAAAERWGRAAIELATEQDDAEVLAYALIQSGVASWMAGDDAGLDRLRRGVDVARGHGLVRMVAQGLQQIGTGGGEIRRYAEAVPALEECVAFADRHELGGAGLYAAAWLARCRLDLGRWDEASTGLAAVLGSPRGQGVARMTALTALGRLRARRGDPEVWAPLDEALALARRTGHLQRLWPVAAARAEAAWLDGRPTAEIDTLEEVYAEACRLAHPWAIGEIGFSLWRAGTVDEVNGAAEPYARHVAGRPAEAARAWAALGCVYEQAAALADSADDADQQAALATFERLGARPAARRLADRRRAAGRSVPRGPNAATKGNPGGLTDRETEVVRLVAAGCTNAEIGARLHITTKTAGHHVSNVLAKLGVRSRAEAVAAALGAGVVLDG